ncbi:hypothetical protein D6T64_10420 [Cryobacterium melibiosiphilum]|uniref:Pilus assembly protein PilO n=1 Tax=Cryobacterium melibiosiphilum TaxID=995039 RepID=A0A3A5MGI5_9MICO|nr:type 4a pilus biogenesis protein PilO [Cryobacterium melibiosiphilum]RJT88532.1 hypothetical protein D6T64_10420 [Cryobacterium melibiosiphilum]
MVTNRMVANRIDSNRVWVVGSALAAVVALLAGWFLGIEPRLAAASTADASRATVEVTNAAHAAVLAQLVEDSRDKKALTAEYNTLTASVPDGTAIPDFVNQLDDLASASELTLSGIEVADAQAYTPGTTVANALITPQSLAALAVDISVSGDYGRVLQFVDGLQTGARLFLVTGITTQVDTDNPGSVEASISGLVYVLVPPGSVIAPVADPTVPAEAATAGVVG